MKNKLTYLVLAFFAAVFLNAIIGHTTTPEEFDAILSKYGNQFYLIHSYKNPNAHPEAGGIHETQHTIYLPPLPSPKPAPTQTPQPIK